MKAFWWLAFCATVSCAGPELPRATEVATSNASQNHSAFANQIPNRSAFDAIARVEGAGRFFELPQVMFAIDRSATPPRVEWINTRKYQFHIDFLQSRYLTLADSETFNAANYSQPGRRFILGSIVRYPRLDRYGVELWEGDEVEPALLSTMMSRLQAGFFAPLTFKPNSDQQRTAAAAAGLPVIGIEEAYGSREQLILNRGRTTGRLILVGVDGEGALLPGDIALLTTMPIRMPPVAGIVSSTFTTPINHVSLLAKTWGIPNVYRANADQLWGVLNGQQVVLDATGSTIIVRRATDAEVKVAERQRPLRAIRTPRADLSYNGFPALAEQNRSWSRRTGAKAANLAEVAALVRDQKNAGFIVPPGFSIPFAIYERFVLANHLDTEIDRLLADPRRNDPIWRSEALTVLRKHFADGRIPEEDFAAIVKRNNALISGKGVFVRSSTNAEDLPGFNGAGLYDTIPNVTNEQALAAAVKQVWGSLWNDRAYAARDAARIDHRAVRAAVLIQAGIDADASGVMTTVDPFDEQTDERRLFIAAKRGIGIRVVEGKKIAEQLVYRPDLDSIQLLTRSQDDVMLHFAPDGGVQEMGVDPNRAVLTDDLVRRLGQIGLAIQAHFSGRPQDIEWLVVDDQIMIVQSRDYVKGN